MPRSERPRKSRRELERRGESPSDIPSEVPAPLRNFLGSLPIEERHQVVAYFEHRTTTVTNTHGMPMPEILAQYQAMWPGAIDFFAAQVQSQSKHRQGIEAEVIPGQVRLAGRGQYISFALVVFTLSIGVYLIERGYSTAGLTTIGLLGAGFTTSFLRKEFGNKEPKEKKAPKKPDKNPTARP